MFARACLQFVFYFSAALSVSGHGRNIDPPASELISSPCRGECREIVFSKETTDYPDPIQLYRHHWFTHGTSIGCKEATGNNCNHCCDTIMDPTLKSVEQLSYPIIYNEGQDKITDHHFSREFACAIYGKQKFDGDIEACVQALPSLQAELSAGNISASIFSANPWMAPGYAPIKDSCGVLGGWPYDNARWFMAGPEESFLQAVHFNKAGFINSYDIPPPFMDPPAGTLGTRVLSQQVNYRMQQAQGETLPAYPTQWTVGEVVEVSYVLSANHGGGHQYRLCPVEHLYDDTLDEACFTENVMEFADGESVFVAYGDDPMNITFDALDVDDSNTEGVWPSGSTWRKIGLPPCGYYRGGAFGCDGYGPQFTDNAPPGIWGYGNDDGVEAHINSPNLNAVIPDWKIVDKVKVPEGLNGDYVLSWRWDSEQTPQIWTSCTIVTITDPVDLLGDGNSDSRSKCQSLMDVVCKSGSFTLFCDALKDADIDMKQFEEKSWTFFIPNDEAFGHIGSVLESLSKEQLTNIVMFHVVADQILMSDDLECKEEIQMLNGKNSRTKCKYGGTLYQSGSGNNEFFIAPQIIQTDIGFCNGVAHVVDGVMLPPKYSVKKETDYY